jgi:hypothetical protein
MFFCGRATVVVSIEAKPDNKQILARPRKLATLKEQPRELYYLGSYNRLAHAAGGF